MIHVLVTVKPSRRFPGKNGELWPFTYLWLLAEAADADERVQVYLVGESAEVPQRPRAVRHLNICTANHKIKVEAAESVIDPAADDVLVLAQLTQPLRERGLLARVAAAARKHGRCAVTATAAPAAAWRETGEFGCWTARTDDCRRPLMDGALYAWTPGNAADIFDPAEPHAVVLRESPPLMVDVDTPADIPPALPAMWAELMTR